MVTVSLAQHRNAKHAREISRFVSSLCRQFSLHEEKLLNAALALTNFLAAQYQFAAHRDGSDHITEQRRDTYVIGYVMGCIATSCDDAGYLASSMEVLLSWVLVVHKVFGMYLREATALLEYCEIEYRKTPGDALFKKGIAEGGLDRALANRGVPASRLAKHLRAQHPHQAEAPDT